MKNGSAGWPQDARHCLRIGAMNDKQIVEESQGAFDVLVLQANLAISAFRGLGSWTALDKPFWIDPITYAFAGSPVHLMSTQKVKRGHPETKVAFKRTFASLVDVYGEPFDRVLETEVSLTPEDFAQVDKDAMVRRVMDWQREVLKPPEGDLKYLPASDLEPVLLTVPFFPLQWRSGADPPAWLELNLELARRAVEIYEPERLAVGLLIETGLFDASPEELETVLAHYAELPVKHLWLWLSDNEEIEMTLPRAVRLRRTIATLRDAGKQVHQAFGGSFSTLLLREGLTSVGHGVGYWEHKNWEPLAGGGVPVLRYFFPPLRRRLRFLDADQVIDATGVASASEFITRVCGCDVCRSTLGDELANFAQFGLVEVRRRQDRWGNPIEYDVPLPISLYLSKRHYLEAKAREVAEVLESGFDPNETLGRAIDENRGQEVDDLRHLEDWQRALA